MVGIDLGDHDAALRMGHRVTVEARERGAFVRPLGNTVVLMPPLSISEDELRELVAIAAESIAGAPCAIGAGCPSSCRKRALSNRLPIRL